jgi:magnesium transporter
VPHFPEALMRTRFILENGKLVPATGESSMVDVYASPSEAEIAELVGTFNIDRHNIDSALDPDENGRLEFEPDHLALIIKRPRNYCSKDDFFFRVTSVGVFLFAGRMVVIMKEEMALFDGKSTFPLKTLHDILIRLIYSTISHFIGHLKVINMISEELEDKINKSLENKYLLNMFTLEKSLVYFLNATTFNAMVFEKLKHNAQKIGFTQDNLEFLDDIIIENAQCLTLTQTYSNILSGLMNARASLISNNLNVMMKNLNALVLAVAIPTFFTGLGGMSEFSAITGIDNWPMAYAGFVLVMLLTGILIYYLIKYLERFWK